MADGFEVVTSGLLVADMGVDRRIPSSACQVLTLAERDVFSLRILVALGQAKVDDVDVVLCAFCSANQEVVGLDVSVDNPFFMHFLDALNHLGRNVEHCLQVELAAAFLEQVLERLAEQIHDHHVIHLSVLALFVAYKVQKGDESFPPEFVDQFAFPKEHNVSLHAYSFFLNDQLSRILPLWQRGTRRFFASPLKMG